jgi:transposase
MISENTGHRLSAQHRVYLACGPTDMRKSIDGLAAIVQHSFELDPFANAWFVFCNKGRDKLKILRWDHNGFWLYYRRLERGRFQWPQQAEGTQQEGATQSEGATRIVSHRQLQWLLDGLTLDQRKAHREVKASYVV